MTTKPLYHPGDLVRFNRSVYTTAPDYDRDWRVVSVRQSVEDGSGWSVDVIRAELPLSTPLHGQTLRRDWWTGCASRLMSVGETEDERFDRVILEDAQRFWLMLLLILTVGGALLWWSI